MPKKKAQALVAQLAAHDDFGQFRFIKKDDGEIWWAIPDLCKVLATLAAEEYARSTNSSTFFHIIRTIQADKQSNPLKLNISVQFQSGGQAKTNSSILIARNQKYSAINLDFACRILRIEIFSFP